MATASHELFFDISELPRPTSHRINNTQYLLC